MKIILSRKGFDSSVGGYPSPILPDGTMLSLPIPSSLDRLSYADIATANNRSYQDIIDELEIGRRLQGKGAHLDPDLVASCRPRKSGWRPSLGQISAAGGHLRKQGVESGDLFLFYGWFRHTARHVSGCVNFTGPKSGFHAIYGYLFIEQVLQVDQQAHLPAWLTDHPHALVERRMRPNNTIYIAAERAPHDNSLPGAGVFSFNESLVLTKPGMNRSCWNLEPRLFRHRQISYHSPAAWKDGYFQSYPRGQEYVVQADRPVIDWANQLLQFSMGNGYKLVATENKTRKLNAN